MSKKRIFLSGGNGFVGRNLRDALGGEYDIFAPGREELELENSDSVHEFFAKNPVDVVLHCASIGGTRKTKDGGIARRNLKIFYNIVECNEHWKKMITFGSGAEYSKAHMHAKMKEIEFGENVPEDEYGRYKYDISRYVEKTDKNIRVLRIFGCFGKYEDYELRFISNNICKAIFGYPITIANQNVKFDYLYVEDLCIIVREFIERDDFKHKHYNVTPSESEELFEIAKKIRDIDGKELDIKVNKEGMGREYSGDNSRLRAEMPDLKFTPIEKAIVELYDYYLSNKKDIDEKKICEDRY